MNQPYLVTVGMFSYNHSKYIRRSIESVLNQKTTFPVQIIVHDDASTDGTQSIIKELEAQYPGRLSVIYQKENQYSKKVGIFYQFIRPNIKGKYYILCECDDYWCDDTKLQKQVDFLESNPEFIGCTHNCYVVNENDEEIDINSLLLVDCKEHIYKRKCCEFVAYFPGPTAAKLYKSEIHFKYPEEFYDELRAIKTQGDVRNNFFLSLEGPVYYMEEKMSVYRRVTSGGDSWSARQKGINMNDKRFIASIQMRRFARKYYHICYKNYYFTFNAGVRAVLMFLKEPGNKENKRVFENIVKEKKNIAFFLLYMIGISFIAIPLYFVRTAIRNNAKKK